MQPSPPAPTPGPEIAATVEILIAGAVAMLSPKVREDRVRRMLAKKGFRLEKTPARSWLRAHYEPGYMICEGNTVISGCLGRAYTDTLEQVEAFALKPESR
jgi:hypothetical protein